MSTVIGEPSVRRCTWIDAKPERVWEEFESLEYKGSSDQQLIELKTKMGLLKAGGDKAKQLGKGSETIHDAELLEDGKD